MSLELSALMSEIECKPNVNLGQLADF
jgi:hypothetical protein